MQVCRRFYTDVLIPSEFITRLFLQVLVQNIGIHLQLTVWTSQGIYSFCSDGPKPRKFSKWQPTCKVRQSRRYSWKNSALARAQLNENCRRKNCWEEYQLEASISVRKTQGKSPTWTYYARALERKPSERMALFKHSYGTWMRLVSASKVENMFTCFHFNT